MLPVLQHALLQAETAREVPFRTVLLFDPTSPCRLPSDVSRAIQMLESDSSADGVIAVSRPEFNPYWHCVVSQGGYLAPLIAGAEKYTRRQQLPTAYRINGALYLWRRDFLLSSSDTWMSTKLMMLEIPESRAINIDDIDEFQRADLLLRHSFVTLPWLGAD